MIANDKKITGEIAIKFVEETILTFIKSINTNRQSAAFQTLFALYSKEGYKTIPELELHTLFLDLINTKKFKSEVIPNLYLIDELLISGIKTEEFKGIIKKFILELNLNPKLTPGLKTFFDTQLHKHLVLNGDVLPALGTVKVLLKAGDQRRATIILKRMLESFDVLKQFPDAQQQIRDGILESVKTLDDLELLNGLLEQFKTIEESFIDTLISTIDAVSMNTWSNFRHLPKFMNNLNKLVTSPVKLKITKSLLGKINTIIKDQKNPTNEKLILIADFLTGFDTLHEDIKSLLVPMAGLVSIDDFYNRNLRRLYENLLRLECYDAFLQIPETLLTNNKSGGETKENVISLVELIVLKKKDATAVVLSPEQKIRTATLLAKVATLPELKIEELHRISAINEALKVPKVSSENKPDQALLITEYSLQNFAATESADSVLALIDYITRSPFEDTNKRLVELAKMLLERGRSWPISLISWPKEEDLDKHGIALDTLVKLAIKKQDENTEKLMQEALTKAFKEAVVHKSLYPKALNLALTRLETKSKTRLPDDPELESSIKAFQDQTRLELPEWTDQYHPESRIQAIKDYAAVFKFLHDNKRLPSSTPLIKCIENGNEQIDVGIATLLLEISNDHVDFRDKLSEHSISSSILNRIEKDSTSTSIAKMKLYKQYLETRFIKSDPTDVTRIVNLFNGMLNSR
ncbi:MAG TPA: hypothetical protein VGP47_09750, partial [Parachlamydiaceae bacterium]|nr:hypothetical protein [Parachlamydiaceae bacterium]